MSYANLLAIEADVVRHARCGRNCRFENHLRSGMMTRAVDVVVAVVRVLAFVLALVLVLVLAVAAAAVA